MTETKIQMATTEMTLTSESCPAELPTEILAMFTIAKIAVKGAWIPIVIRRVKTCWSWVISFVERVIKEGIENLLISVAEKSLTFWKYHFLLLLEDLI